MTTDEAIQIFRLAMGMVFTEPDEAARELDAEDGKPTYLLLDEIWEIIDHAGHGTPVLIHHTGSPTEVMIYDRYASQDDNMKFMEHISDELEKGTTVTVNGTNIFDLY